MDPNERFTTQQQVETIEAYLATKSVVLTQEQCRRDFGSNNVPDGSSIQRLVATFLETASVADAAQRPQWSTSFKPLKSKETWSFSIL